MARRSGTRESGSTSRTRRAATVARRLARLADGLAQAARGATAAAVVEQPALVVRRGAEGLDLERERLRRGRQLGQRGPRARRIRAGSALASRRVTARRQVPPSTKRADRASARSERPRRSRAGEHAGHEELQRTLELRARGRLGQLEALPHRLGRAAGHERGVAPEREVERQEAGVAEALGERARPAGRRARRACARRAARALGQRLELGARAQERRRAAARGRPARAPADDDPGPARARVARGGVGGEAAGRRAERGRPSARARRAAGSTPSRRPPWMPSRPADGEVGLARAVGLDLRPDALEPVEHDVPQRAHALGVGRHEDELGAAGERLPHAHPRRHAEGLGRRGDLPHELLAARLGREGHGLGRAARAARRGGERAGGGGRGRTRSRRTHVRIGAAACKMASGGPAPGPPLMSASCLGPGPTAPPLRALGSADYPVRPAAMLAMPVAATSTSTAVKRSWSARRNASAPSTCPASTSPSSPSSDAGVDRPPRPPAPPAAHRRPG